MALDIQGEPGQSSFDQESIISQLIPSVPPDPLPGRGVTGSLRFFSSEVCKPGLRVDSHVLFEFLMRSGKFSGSPISSHCDKALVFMGNFMLLGHLAM